MSKYSWVASHTLGSIPADAFRGGHDINGNVIYVGRSQFYGELIPCKIVARKRDLYAAVSYNCKEHRVKNFEFLCGRNFLWKIRPGGITPRGAVLGGGNALGEKYYVGRAYCCGALFVGRVSRTYLLAPCKKPHWLNDIEILTERQ